MGSYQAHVNVSLRCQPAHEVLLPGVADGSSATPGIHTALILGNIQRINFKLALGEKNEWLSQNQTHNTDLCSR